MLDERILFQMIVKLLDENEGHAIFTRHAYLRMKERSISVPDVYEILRNPTYIKKESESKDKKFVEKYNYRVMGKFDWSVVISVHYPDNIIVITVID
ncbi:hypothetical protein BSK59_15710 [Paenibacillus odorifer]|uniref:DUF4258 domain-containing protein n=1 Tax=Paenibacillus odorifer TaxID=189426 RepID=UPI000979DB16|nr:DUF4258 domain-containing protein [Paenibacillus odorifer]OME54026.1 hypothetical protein BSK59_15710 [Paenibacillus odorifer]